MFHFPDYGSKKAHATFANSPRIHQKKTLRIATLLGTITYPIERARTWVDDFPFPLVGYVFSFPGGVFLPGKVEIAPPKAVTFLGNSARWKPRVGRLVKKRTFWEAWYVSRQIILNNKILSIYIYSIYIRMCIYIYISVCVCIFMSLHVLFVSN